VFDAAAAPHGENTCKATGKPLTAVVDEFAEHLVRCDHAAEAAARLGQADISNDRRARYRCVRVVRRRNDNHMLAARLQLRAAGKTELGSA
jgi:hypothetical protein